MTVDEIQTRKTQTLDSYRRMLLAKTAIIGNNPAKSYRGTIESIAIKGDGHPGSHPGTWQFPVTVTILPEDSDRRKTIKFFSGANLPLRTI